MRLPVLAPRARFDGEIRLWTTLSCVLQVDKLVLDGDESLQVLREKGFADLILASREGHGRALRWSVPAGRHGGSATARWRFAAAQNRPGMAMPRPQAHPAPLPACAATGGTIWEEWNRTAPKLGPGASGGRVCDVSLRYLHTMVRVTNIEQSLDFYCEKLGMEEVRRVESEAGRYTLVFLAAPDDKGRAAAERAPLLELTFNWDPEKYDPARPPTSAIWPTRAMTVLRPVRPADEGWRHHQPSRRATGAWRSCARPTTFPIDCLAARGGSGTRRSRGRRCPTPASGDAACLAQPASRRNLLKI